MSGSQQAQHVFSPGSYDRFQSWSLLYKNRHTNRLLTVVASIALFGSGKFFFQKLSPQTKEEEARLDKIRDAILKAFGEIERVFLQGTPLTRLNSPNLMAAAKQLGAEQALDQKVASIYELYKRVIFFPQQVEATSAKRREEIRGLCDRRSQGIDQLDRIFKGKLSEISQAEEALDLYFRAAAFVLEVVGERGKQRISPVLFSKVILEWALIQSNYSEEKMAHGQGIEHPLSRIFKRMLPLPKGKSDSAFPDDGIDFLFDDNIGGQLSSFRQFLAYLSVKALSYNRNIQFSKEVEDRLFKLFCLSEAARCDLLSATNPKESHMVTEEGKKWGRILSFYKEHRRKTLGPGQMESFIEDQELMQILCHSDLESTQFPQIEGEERVRVIRNWENFKRIRPLIFQNVALNHSQAYSHFSRQMYRFFLSFCKEPLFDDRFVQIFTAILEQDSLYLYDKTYEFLFRALETYFTYIRDCFDNQHSHPLLIMILSPEESSFKGCLPSEYRRYFREALTTVATFESSGKFAGGFPVVSGILTDLQEKSFFCAESIYSLVFFIAKSFCREDLNRGLRNLIRKDFHLEPKHVLDFLKKNQGATPTFYQRFFDILQYGSLGRLPYKSLLFTQPPLQIRDLAFLQKAFDKAIAPSALDGSIEQAKSGLEYQLPPEVDVFLYRLCLFYPDRLPLFFTMQRNIGYKPYERVSSGEKAVLPFLLSEEVIDLLENDSTYKSLSSLTPEQNESLHRVFHNNSDLRKISDHVVLCLYMWSVEALLKGRGWCVDFLKEALPYLVELGDLLDSHLILSNTFYLYIFIEMDRELIEALLKRDEKIKREDIEWFFKYMAPVCGHSLSPLGVNWYHLDETKLPPVAAPDVDAIQEELNNKAKTFVESLDLPDDQDKKTEYETRLRQLINFRLFPFTQRLNEAFRVKKVRPNVIITTVSAYAAQHGILKGFTTDSRHLSQYVTWVTFREGGGPCLIFSFVTERSSFSIFLDCYGPIRVLGEKKFFEQVLEGLPLYTSYETTFNEAEAGVLEDSFFGRNSTALFGVLRRYWRLAPQQVHGEQHRAAFYLVDEKGAIERLRRSQKEVSGFSEEEINGVREQALHLLQNMSQDYEIGSLQFENRIRDVQIKGIPFANYQEEEARISLDEAANRSAERKLKELERGAQEEGKTGGSSNERKTPRSPMDPRKRKMLYDTARQEFFKQYEKDLTKSVQKNLVDQRILITLRFGNTTIPLQLTEEVVRDPDTFRKRILFLKSLSDSAREMEQSERRVEVVGAWD